MKKALIKEWYINRLTIIISACLPLFSVVLYYLQWRHSIALMSLGIVIPIFFFRFSFEYEKKSGWADYECVLPEKPIHRISAKFLSVLVISYLWTFFDGIILADFTKFTIDLIGVIADVQSVLPQQIFGIIFLSANLYVANAFWLRFLFPDNNLKRIFTVLAEAFVIMLLLAVLTGKYMKTLVHLMTEEPWFVAAAVAASLLLLAASWAFSVGAVSVNSKDYTKKMNSISLVFVCLAVLTVGVSFGIAYSKGSVVVYEKEERTTLPTQVQDAELERQESIKLMKSLLLQMDESYFVGKTKEDFYKFAEKLNLKENDEGDKFLTEKEDIYFKIDCDEQTGLITEFSLINNSTANSVILYGKASVEALYEDFYIGMTEQELIDYLTENEIIPSFINDYNDYVEGYEDRVLERQYSFYSSSLKSYYTVVLSVVDGKIVYKNLRE